MNLAQHRLFRLILFTLGAVIFTWISPIDYNLARSQTSLIPTLNLQQRSVRVLASEIDLPPEVKSAVLNDVVGRTSKTVSAMKILEVKQQQWSDGCLGLGSNDEICTQAITPGYQVVVTDGINDWTYRTNEVGNAVRLEQRN